jgi:hypothetical protein
MSGKVDRTYWKDYFKTYNEKRYDDLVNNFYTENATFHNPKFSMNGRKDIASFFKAHHTNVNETLTPVTVIITPEVCALELDGVFSSELDLPDFYVMPLKKGAKVPMKMGVFYHMSGDRIIHANVYWM